jgi:hypothetical protein
MSKLLAMVATLKAILIAACVAFARGDMLSVILIGLVQPRRAWREAGRSDGAAQQCGGFGKQRSQSLISNSPDHVVVPMMARSIRLNEAHGFVSVLA